jgi:NAD(P)-dependent dehydrogenase (short-subunit alcohol dehydrogenase family)
MDLSLNLAGSHVLITGGTGYIGTVCVDAFISAGAKVTSLDLRAPKDPPSSPNFRFLSCDISSGDSLETAFATAAETFGPVACCVALASLDLSVLQHHDSLADMDVEQWRRTHRINVEGTFLTARAWLRALREVVGSANSEHKSLANVSLIIVGSESGHFGERGNADYAAGKSAVQGGLLRSLMGDVARIWPGAR